jgi:uncharacterized protein
MLTLDKVFSRKGAQKKVAEFLLKNAVRISADGRLFAKEMEIPHTAVAKVLDVDRRVIKATVDSILAEPKLKKIYSKLDYALLLRDVAPDLGFGAIEIIPTDAAEKGIIAGVTKVIVDSKISIRQIISDDPMIPGAETTVITEKPLPRTLIDKMLKIRGVKKVIVIS